MDDLQRALSDIVAIRSQIARHRSFLGYGPTTVAITGLLALIAAALQQKLAPNPSSDPLAYVLLWTGAAALSAAIAAFEVISRARRRHIGMAQEMVAAAAEQVLPAGMTGALLTIVLWRYVPAALWMLPGLWQITFSLGIFASCRFLPNLIVLSAVWYLLCGLASLAFAQGAWAFSPWAMAIPFGVGQAFIALVLYAGRGGADGR